MSELVVGDVVDIKFGDRVRADMRIAFAQALKVGTSNILKIYSILMQALNRSSNEVLVTALSNRGFHC